MLREEANMVTDYLREGGYLTGELEEMINDNVDDEVKDYMHLLRNRDELRQLTGYSIVSVIGTENEEGIKGSLISFRKLREDGSSCIDLSLSGDGNIYISDKF